MRPTSLARHDLRLSNGLPVVLVSQPAVHSAVVALYLRVGSRFETAETNGISHFLEHMLFRGTASLPTSHAQSLAFERLGGTLYAANGPSNDVSVIDVATLKVIKSIKVGRLPWGVVVKND